MFCSGVGEDYPDITNSSAGISLSALNTCERNGVSAVTAVKIGYDGIVLANSRHAARFSLSRRDLFLALAKNVPDGENNLRPNPNKTWNDIRSDLPHTKIEVLGPPPTSGTRTAFAELVMEAGCRTFPSIAKMEEGDKSGFRKACRTIREDGAYRESGENDNLIVRNLERRRNALGIFGFSFLDQNKRHIQGSLIDGVEPAFETIASGEYPASRPLWFFVKNDQVDKTPGIREYLTEFTSEKAWGTYGYLKKKGLIPAPAPEREKYRNALLRQENNIRDVAE